MSKALCVFALVALMGVAANATYYSICPGEERKCGASVNINSFQFGAGSCKVTGSAYCSVYSKSEKCFDYAYDGAYGECRDVYVQEDAECYAKAVAKAFASAYGSVDCQGKKAYGCVEAEADAHTIACSLAVAIVDLSVALDRFDAECQIYIGAAVEAVAGAWADANIGVCGSGQTGFVYDSDFEFSFAVQEAIAKAYAKCVVYCDDYGVFVTGSGHTFGDTYESLFGDACVGSDC